MDSDWLSVFVSFTSWKSSRSEGDSCAIAPLCRSSRAVNFESKRLVKLYSDYRYSYRSLTHKVCLFLWWVKLHGSVWCLKIISVLPRRIIELFLAFVTTSHSSRPVQKNPVSQVVQATACESHQCTGVKSHWKTGANVHPDWLLMLY